ncbi:14569_t:CDS:2 [Acaulospora morrowiae]|uniref:14569_t:CDS:1 n=1 Tax=Acaulospora morrowiae TaxID=94023 RepID=A0A9N9C8C2_9GLOM|nr:14569_t:CDS:2 [Acaulospora morrowiae]
MELISTKKLKNHKKIVDEKHENFIRKFRKLIKSKATSRGNIVKIIEHFYSAKTYFMIIQYAHNGDLGTCLRTKFLEQNEYAKANLIPGVEGSPSYVNNARTMHGNLDFTNILTKNGGILMVMGFGSSVSLDEESFDPLNAESAPYSKGRTKH